MDTVDKLLLHFRRQHRRAEGFPPGCHRAGELLKEVLDAAGPATEMVEHHVAHDAPAQTRPPGQGGVDVGGADDAFGNEVIDLARQRGLQAVGDMPRHFLVDAHRPLPDRRIKFAGAPDRLFGSLGTADDFGQRDQVRRIERMSDDASLGMGLSAQLDVAHLEPRRARPDDHVRRQQLVELPIELLLEIDPLGPVLLDQVDAGDRLREICRELEVRLRRSRRQAQSLERRPGRLHELAERSFCVRRNVRCDDLQSLGEKQRGPARADHAGADDGDAVNGFSVAHVMSPMRSSDFGVGDAGEIALGVKEVALILSIEIGGIDRTGEVGDEHPVARNVEGDADPFHQVCDQNLWRRLFVDWHAVDGVAARRIAAVGPIEDAARQIELEVNGFWQFVE